MPTQRRKDPILTFLIPSDGAAISQNDWASREPHAVWYGIPETQRYPHPVGGSFRRCRVEAFAADGRSLGYLPLPERYADAWVQLCYSIVYWMWQWKAWVGELQTQPRMARQPANFVRDCMNNTGTRFLKYLTIRRLIIDELLQHSLSKDGSDELLVFDEYLIRDRFDWLWTDIGDLSDRELAYLQLDPVHESNNATFSWRNPKLLVPEEMIAPTQSPTLTWIWGRINHFNVEKAFDKSFRGALQFYRSKALRRSAQDMPYSPDAQGLPIRWHEGHEPAVRFLTQEEDSRLRCPSAPRLETTTSAPTAPTPQAGTAGSSPAPEAGTGAIMPAAGISSPVHPLQPAKGERSASGPSAPITTYKGIVDNPQVREVINNFAQQDGGLDLPEVLRRLQSILGAQFDEEQWGRILDAVSSAPDEEPMMTVDQAFEFYRSHSAVDTHAKSMENYRNVAKKYL